MINIACYLPWTLSHLVSMALAVEEGFPMYPQGPASQIHQSTEKLFSVAKQIVTPSSFKPGKMSRPPWVLHVLSSSRWCLIYAGHCQGRPSQSVCRLIDPLNTGTEEINPVTGDLAGVSSLRLVGSLCTTNWLGCCEDAIL